MSLRLKLFVLLLLLGGGLSSVSAAAEPAALNLTVQQQEIEVRRFPAEGNYLALWFASGNGFDKRHHQVAQALQQQGIESWQVNLLESLFLPRGSSSIRRIDDKLVATLIAQARKQSGKKLVLISNSYGAIPVLRGMRAWQQTQHSERALLGAIMFSPNAYAGIPSLGLPPEYVPVVYATNMPIMILQSGRNGNRGQLDELVTGLHSGGSAVFVQIMRGATSLFYTEDKTAATLAHLQQAPHRIAQAIRLLDRLPQPSAAAPLPEPDTAEEQLGLDIALKPFRGNWSPPTLALKDARGEPHVIDDYTGKVRVINFWATWCPPCVEEIPSLNRLREKLADAPFELISVNYAQQAEEVKAFLNRVEVNFPVLIDQDGKEAERWKVIAFPSTYVIDANGKIRYGVNAAIEWDKPEVIRRLRALIRETK